MENMLLFPKQNKLSEYFEFSIYLLAEKKTEAIFTCGNKMKTFYFAWENNLREILLVKQTSLLDGITT